MRLTGTEGFSLFFVQFKSYPSKIKAVLGTFSYLSSIAGFEYGEEEFDEADRARLVEIDFLEQLGVGARRFFQLFCRNFSIVVGIDVFERRLNRLVIF